MTPVRVMFTVRGLGLVVAFVVVQNIVYGLARLGKELGLESRDRVRPKVSARARDWDGEKVRWEFPTCSCDFRKPDLETAILFTLLAANAPARTSTVTRPMKNVQYKDMLRKPK